VAAISWHRAAQFCVELSAQEGIPPDQHCYDIELKHGFVVARPYDNYLQRTGYRLLTAAEWEYACRAGTTTPFSWGRDARLSTGYAWQGSDPHAPPQPVGLLRPNLFGLFDMHGNVGEWLHDFGDSTNREISGPDIEKLYRVDSERMVRGDRGDSTADGLRSANLMFEAPDQVGRRIGFRIGRTLPTRNGE
jgi:formylglycine-generating enzyme required for sulfatase activity